MNQEITLRDTNIAYTLRVSRCARHMRLTVYPGGTLVMTLPRGSSHKSAENFLRRKATWVLEKVAYFKKLPVRVLRPRSLAHYRAHRENAHRFVEERLKILNQSYGFAYGAIGIRNQKTQWGSCSERRTLHFNYRILFLPPLLADYVIVHELCHVKELNHSQEFWNLVANSFPNFRAIKQVLRKYDLGSG